MAKVFDDANFEQEVLKADKVALVDFFTPSCGPCRKLAPTIDKLSEELKDVAVVGKADVSENMELAMTYRISAVPTLIVFKDGKEVKRHMGVMSDADLRKWVEEAK